VRFSRLHIPVRPWLLVSAAWLVPTLLAASQGLARALLARRAVDWRSLFWDGGDWFICAFLTPFVFALAARLPLRQGTLWRNVLPHLLAALVFCAAWAAIGALLRILLVPRSDDWFPSPVEWFLTTLPFGFAIYFGVVASEHAFRFLFESRQSATRAALLAAQLAEARLGALRMQLNPHFLFNSLNTILVMVRDGDDRNAADSIERLAGVLRRILRADRRQEVPLAEEIDFLKEYLAIEQARFSDRLRPRFDVPESLGNAQVPDLMLQPIVENALRHGIGKRTESGELIVTARRRFDDLVLTVQDDGAGLPETGAQEGVGLSNTRERLATLYGTRGRLDVSPAEPRGVIVAIRLPFHDLPADREDRP
jgi:two-component system, LytTR family, sensor kinase